MEVDGDERQSFIKHRILQRQNLNSNQRRCISILLIIITKRIVAIFLIRLRNGIRPVLWQMNNLNTHMMGGGFNLYVCLICNYQFYKTKGYSSLLN